MAPEDRLRQLVLGHLRLVRDHPALPEIMVMRDPSEAQSASLSQIRASMSGFRDNLIDTIREAQSDGRFRADIGAKDGATLIFGIIQGLVLRLLLSRDPEILAEGRRAAAGFAGVVAYREWRQQLKNALKLVFVTVPLVAVGAGILAYIVANSPPPERIALAESVRRRFA